jgi:YfiH family protein
VNQVHGNRVHRVTGPGSAGDGDAVWTTVPGLPLAVLTADCHGVVLSGAGAVGIAHAGWRGVEEGVVPALVAEMTEAGAAPAAAAVGPGIGPCCFEVGPEVAARFPDHTSTTTWETESVDLAGAIRDQLAGLDVWVAGPCTFHDDGLFSYRRDGTRKRLASIAWLRAHDIFRSHGPGSGGGATGGT